MLVGNLVSVWGRKHRNSVLSTQICCEHTTALKNKIYYFENNSKEKSDLKKLDENIQDM